MAGELIRVVQVLRNKKPSLVTGLARDSGGALVLGGGGHILHDSSIVEILYILSKRRSWWDSDPRPADFLMTFTSQPL